MDKRKKEAVLKRIMITAAAMVVIVLVIFAGGEEKPEKEPFSSDGINFEEIKIEQVQEINMDLGGGIRIDDIGKYTGIYMEDGTNDIVTGVMMMVVTNTGEKALQYAEIHLKFGEKDAFFTVSTLLPGASAVLLEKNRMDFEVNAEYGFAFMENVVFFSEEPQKYENKLEMQILDGGLNVTNISGGDIPADIVIYYKNSSVDMYYGGITYRIRIEGGLLDGETRQIMAEHFHEKGSTVMFVTIG